MDNLSLKQLQREFSSAIKDASKNEIFLSQIISSANLSTKSRLAIYRESMNAGLAGSLSLTYPAVVKLVGEEFFSLLAADYCQQTPSTSPSLDDYGASFAAFIKSHSKCLSLPYLSDVANLEWAYQASLHGPDIKSKLNFIELAQTINDEGDSIVLEIPDNCALIDSSYPLLHIWQICKDDYKGDENVDLNQGACKLLVWRKLWQVEIEPLTNFSWQLLQACQNGLNLKQIIEKLKNDDGFSELEQVLTDFTKKGIFVGFNYGSN